MAGRTFLGELEITCFDSIAAIFLSSMKKYYLRNKK
jgi:hypothetical protein